jgi:glyoxylase I family protein
MIRGIHHTCISTADIDRAIDFYLKVLPGSELVYKVDVADSKEFDLVVGLDNAVATGAVIRTANTYLELFQFQNPGPVAGPRRTEANDLGYTHFCLDVDDVYVEYERCKALGMTFDNEPQAFPDLGIRTVYGRDLDGNIVELQEVKNRPDLVIPGLQP